MRRVFLRVFLAADLSTRKSSRHVTCACWSRGRRLSPSRPVAEAPASSVSVEAKSRFVVRWSSVPGVAIRGAGSVAKTFPQFYEMLAELSR